MTLHEPVWFGYPIHLLFLYFMIYSFLGWCMETTFCSIQERRLVPRGFLFGPICPIYGAGVLMMICWFAPFMGHPLLFYLVATVCMSAWEYFVGWFLETTTHIKYWDYSMYKFNLKGRICLWVCLTWGVLAYIILFWIHPPIARLVLRVPPLIRCIVSAVLAAAILADTVTTIRKLALTAKLMRALEDLRAQLAQGKTELETMLQEAKEGISEKLAAANRERKAKRTESNASLQTAYNDLLAKTERQSRRFLNRYHAMSSRHYSLDLSELKSFGNQLKQRLAQARQERKQSKHSHKKEKV